MNNGLKYSFWQFIKENEERKILIPKIQRDYIQYRSGRVANNLNNFIETLVLAIINDKPVNLNFIYGISKMENNNSMFIPIDGQQRLTTLYLLHYYIFNEVDEKIDNVFKYDTRETTQMFLDCLAQNTVKFSRIDKKPSEMIKEASWYTSLWDNDPSVRSCLKVLDVIKNQFDRFGNNDDFREYANLLKCNDAPINDEQKPNELYIKMNSRGKQLTAFENFKAELFYALDDKNCLLDFKSDFKIRMDGDWLNYIWELSKSDTLFKKLTHFIFVNRINIVNDNPKITFENYENSFVEDYKRDLLNIGNWELAIEDIYYTFNLLTSLNDELLKGYVAIMLKGNEYIEYPIRVMLFAITLYARKKQVNKVDSGHFASWWRIVKNLINNATIDKPENYVASLKILNNYPDIENIAENILNLVNPINSPKLPGLRECQWIEERFKQQIIDTNGYNWQEVIIVAENYSHFNGEINFLLKLSEVVDVATSKNKLDEFKKNFVKLKIILEAEDDYYNVLLHQVLLVYGNYSEKMSVYDNEKDYLISYYYNDSKHHERDWRGFLRRDKCFDIFKKMFDEFNNEMISFKDFVKEKCRNNKYDKESLEYYLVTMPELFTYIKSYGRCWKYDGDIYLLQTSNRKKIINYKLFVAKLMLNKEGFKVSDNLGKPYTNEVDYLFINNQSYSYNKSKKFYNVKTGETVAYSIEQFVNMFNNVVISI